MTKMESQESFQHTVSDSVPDWSREQSTQSWDPGKKLIASIRSYQKWRAQKGTLGLVMAKAAVLRHRFWSSVTSADIPINCQIAGGLLIPHPTGIVIHPNAVIGPNCLILQQVTITEGTTIGGHVDIGAGAKILGSATIGNNAKIGANAVVLRDVPAGNTAVGIPARIVTHARQPSEDR